MKDSSLKKKAGVKLKDASGDFVKGFHTSVLRLALMLLILGAFATSLAMANEPPVAGELTPNKASPQDVGTTIKWTATATDPDGDPVSYRFYLKGPSPSEDWQLKRDWDNSNKWDWTPDQPGDFQINVWIGDPENVAAGTWGDYRIVDYTVIEADTKGKKTFTISIGPGSTAILGSEPATNQPPVFNSLTSSPTSPQNVGTSVRWTADAADPESDPIYYKFYLKGPSTGGAWSPVRDWSTTNFWDWTTSQQGDYEVNVWIRDGKHAGNDGWDAYKITPFTVNPAPVPNQPPVFNSLTSSPTSPQNVGTSVRWTADADDPESDPIYYKFYLKGPSTGGAWSPVRDWSTTNFWDWTTSQQGDYEVNVWIRDGEHAGTDGWDAYKITPFKVNLAPVPNQPPVFNSLTSSPTSPQNAGTSVKWTADAYDPESDPIYYKFYLKGPSTGGAWSPVRDWSTTNFWDWTTSQQGDYEVNVWIRDGEHAGTDGWDAYKITPFTVNPAPVPNQPPVFNSLTSSPTSPQNAGTSVRWTADADDPESDPIYYKFYLKGPSTGGAWSPVRDWSTTNFWDWTTSQQGDYEVNVWIRDGEHAGTDGWDAYKITPFTVNPAPVPNQPPVFNSLTSSPTSPQNAGTSVKWTADADDPESDPIYYKFYLKGPSTGGAWSPVRDWGTTNFWDWTTSQQGDYEVNVWIRDGEHAGTDGWDANKITPFKVNPAPVPNQPPVFNSLTSSPTSPQNVGTSVKWTADADDPESDPIYYKFYLKGPSTGGAWSPVRDWSTTNFWDWTTSQQGDYEVNVWIRDGKHAGTDGWDAYKITPFTVNPAPTPNQPPVFNSLTPNKSSPQNLGTTIRWTADATDPDPADVVYYKFYLKGPSTSGAWQAVQDWGTKNWWDWTPTQKGDYEINVWIRDGKHAGPDSWDAYKITPFTVNPAPTPNQPPVFNSLTPNKSSPQNLGTTIRWTADATDPDPGDVVYYKFYLKGPSTSGAWQAVQDWGTKNWWDWTPTQKGDYEINVWIRDGKHAGPDSWDAYKIVPFTVNAVPNQPPVVTALTPNRYSPQIAGATITWTATATDPDGDPILYRFWMKGPSTGNVWKVVKDWSTSRTWTWSTSSGDAGEYDFCVYVRDGKHESASRYDSCTGYKGYQLIVIRPINQPPTVTALSPNRPSPQSAGSAIVWTASATDPDRDTLFYKFWLKGPSTGNAWNVVRDWSTSSSWTWSSSTGDAGLYDVYVYVRDGKHESTSRYDSAKGYGGYQLTSPVVINQPPTVTALSPNKPSPQSAGSAIVWTASATDPDRDTLFYKFWLKGPSTGNAWNVVRDWSTSSSWTWSSSTGDAGLYDVYVYVRDGKHESTSRYDSAKGYGGYQLTSPVVINQPPTLTALSPNKPSPQSAGSAIVWTASATDPDRDTLFYKFWLKGPSTGNAWNVVRDWSTSSSWTWSSSTGDAGLYDVYVYVRDGKHESTSRYDSAKGYGGYQLTSPVVINQPPTVTALSPSRPSPQPAGTTVVWTASASDPDGDPLLYKFWMKGPSTGNAWTIVQDWSSSNSWSWSSGAGDAGEYNFYVYVRDGKHESASRYDSATGYSGYQLVSFGGVYQLTSGDAIQDRPALVYGDEGYLLAYQSWEAGSFYSGDIFLKRFDPEWNLLQKVRATSELAYQDTPSVVYSDGYYYVAYVSDETGNWDIFMKMYDEDLNLIDTRRLTTSTYDQDRPSLTRVGSDFYLAYQSWEMGPSYSGDIYIERFNSAWTSMRKVRVTSETSYQDRPSLAYAGDEDKLYVAYTSEEYGNQDIVVKKYDRNLNSLDKKRITTSSSSQDYPSLIWQNGEFDLVYSSKVGTSYDLYLERFSPSWGLIEKVAVTGTSGDEIWPSLAYSPSYGILWVAYVLQEGEGGDIFVQPARSIDSGVGCWAAMDFSATRAYNPYTLTVKFYGPTGQLTDPSSLRLTWNPADAVLTSSTLGKISTGTYQLESRFGSAGLKTFTVSSSVAGCSAESTVTVQVT